MSLKMTYNSKTGYSYEP